MKLPQLAGAREADARLARAVGFTFLGSPKILALYFGRDVLIPAAVAVLFAFILSPVVTWGRRLLPSSVAVALVVVGVQSGTSSFTNAALFVALRDAAARVARMSLQLLTNFGRARHAVIDYDVAPAPPSVAGAAGSGDLLIGDIATICRLAAQYAVELASAHEPQIA